MTGLCRRPSGFALTHVISQLYVTVAAIVACARVKTRRRFMVAVVVSIPVD